jgi:hypothetical protein
MCLAQSKCLRNSAILFPHLLGKLKVLSYLAFSPHLAKSFPQMYDSPTSWEFPSTLLSDSFLLTDFEGSLFSLYMLYAINIEQLLSFGSFYFHKVS